MKNNPLKNFFEAVYLDTLSIPGLFMNKKGNALWHLNHICPKCSPNRRNFRDPKKQGNCIWQNEWQNKNYNFPRSFGFINWIKYYLGIKTNLEKYS